MGRSNVRRTHRALLDSLARHEAPAQTSMPKVAPVDVASNEHLDLRRYAYP